ncbi:MAG: tetratricopeptide repeat protein [Bacteroidia bacterium]
MSLKFYFSVFFSLSCLFFTSLAQDSTTARILSDQAKEFYVQDLFDSALISFEKAGMIYQSLNSWEGYIDVLNSQSIIQRRMGNYSRALDASHTAIQVALDHGVEGLPLGNAYYYLGAIYMRSENHEAALEAVEKGIAQIQADSRVSASDRSKFFILSGLIYKLTGDFEKAIRDYQEARKILETDPEISPAELALVYNNLGNVYKQKEDYEAAFRLQFKALDIYLQQYGEDHWQMVQSYINLANLYNHTGEYQTAIEYFEKARRNTLNTWGENSPHTASIYNNLGITYIKQQELLKAQEYLKKALEIHLSQGRQTHPSVARIYNNLGLVYRRTGDFLLSEQALIQSQEIYQENYGYLHPNIAQSFNNLGLTKTEMKQFPEAKINYEKAIQIWTQLYGPENPALSNAWNNLGLNAFDQKNYTEALGFFQKSLAIRQGTLPANHPLIMGNYHNISRCLVKMGNIEGGLAMVQQALATFDPDIDISNKYALPNISLASGDKVMLTQVLHQKAEILQNLYDRENKLTHLEETLHTLEVNCQLIDLIRTTYYSRESKSFFGAEAKKTYESAMRIAYLLFQKTQDQQYINRAFLIAEQSKSFILLSALYDSRAKKFAGIPDEILQKEAQLNQNLIHFEKLLFSAESEEELTDQEYIRRLKNRIFSYRQSRDSLIQEMEAHYPEYYRLKHTSSYASVEEIQQHLNPDRDIFISYFRGDSTLYGFKIEADHISMIDLNYQQSDSLLIEQFLQSTGTYFESQSPSDSLYQDQAEIWVKSAYQLYHRFLSRILENETGGKNLIIIPDGLLGYLPFEAMLTESVNAPNAFHSHPYLIRKHPVSYSFSASLWLEMRGKTDSWYRRHKILALGPSFPENTQFNHSARTHISPLYFNQSEAQIAGEIFDGKVLLGSDATLQNFLWLAPRYQILHLATHGSTNDEKIDYSFLAFSPTDDSLEENRIFVRDLYNLNLDAELAVLSACETGTGKLLKGEGIASLARGFSFAGVKSLVTSLWKVNDQKTAELMELFYLQLKPGKEKQIALQQAKLNYLSKNDDFHSHPYFWAGFIPVGNMSPITNQPFPWGWLVFILVIGMGMFWGLKKYY